MSRRQLSIPIYLPRKPRLVRMHVVDAGNGNTADAPKIARFECKRCGHDSGWAKVRTATEAKRGIPCPKCNPGLVEARP